MGRVSQVWSQAQAQWVKDPGLAGGCSSDLIPDSEVPYASRWPKMKERKGKKKKKPTTVNINIYLCLRLSNTSKNVCEKKLFWDWRGSGFNREMGILVTTPCSPPSKGTMVRTGPLSEATSIPSFSVLGPLSLPVSSSSRKDWRV